MALKFTLVGIALVIACSKSGSSGPSCKQISDHVVALLEAELESLEPGEREALKAQFATIRSELTTDCKKEPETFEGRADCIMTAKTVKELAPCDGARGSE